MSATARIPWAPWKYASRRSSRKPLEPMMSQIVMSICTGSPPFGLSASSFLETFAPKVTMYRSSYSFRTYRLMREVLPTACSPTKHTLTFIRRGSIMTMRRRRGAKILSARAICEGLFSRFVLRWRRERIERILRGRLPAVQIPEARDEFETKRRPSREGRLSKTAQKGSPRGVPPSPRPRGDSARSRSSGDRRTHRRGRELESESDFPAARRRHPVGVLLVEVGSPRTGTGPDRVVRPSGVPPRRGHVRFAGLGFRGIPEHDDGPLVGSGQCIYPRIPTAGRGLGPDDDPHFHARAPASRDQPLLGRDARKGRPRVGHRQVGRRALVVGLLGERLK